ncbi:MAG: beta-propeller fold lactonase family protein, partial [Protaetiibacter sp.]
PGYVTGFGVTVGLVISAILTATVGALTGLIFGTARTVAQVLGAWPRHFRLTPDGAFLLVANQNSDEVVSFAVDDRGGLAWTGHRLAIPTPTMIRYW